MEIKINCSYSKMENIYSVIPNPRNPNRHPDDQIKRLAEIIKFTGFRSPIVISSRSGFVVKGHGRLMAANLLKMEYVPVDIQDYESEAQEFSDMIADNRIAELSEIDNAALSELLGELPEIDFTGFTQDEFNSILTDITEFDESFTLPDDEKKLSQMTFTMANEQANLVQSKIECILNSDEFNYTETFGNVNKNGNALYFMAQKYE